LLDVVDRPSYISGFNGLSNGYGLLTYRGVIIALSGGFSAAVTSTTQENGAPTKSHKDD